MKIHDGQAVLFSVKCFVAAMLAYYVALSIGLPRPYWAVTTSYIVAQPLAGAVLSKAVFRLIGTIVGATVAFGRTRICRRTGSATERAP